MQLAALCVTYGRPVQLGHLIHCFQRQTYPKHLRRLVILDDTGQYGRKPIHGPDRGDGTPEWILCTASERFPTLGQKRNACLDVAPTFCTPYDGYAVADDDDVYLPHWLQAHADALRVAPWSRPSIVLHPDPEWNELWRHRTYAKPNPRNVTDGKLFHGGWAFAADLLEQYAYNPALSNGEDQDLAGRLLSAGVRDADPCKMGQFGHAPFYIYPWYDDDSDEPRHLSWDGAGNAGYQKRGELQLEPVETLQITPPRIDLDRPPIRGGITYPRRF